jgi:LysR family glycine cleavage system transcriptional activator
MWLRARGVHVATPLHGPRHLLSSSVIDEAVAGTGVALAKSVIAAGDIAAGRLKPLFGDSTPLASGYWIVWPQTRALTGAATHFVQWLREELESEFGPRD